VVVEIAVVETFMMVMELAVVLKECSGARRFERRSPARLLD
jgi:hypothetical protein